jgi:pimeloyl-ACP methyl ester carboxylesterase
MRNDAASCGYHVDIQVDERASDRHLKPKAKKAIWGPLSRSPFGEATVFATSLVRRTSGPGVLADRSQYFKDLSFPLYGYNRPDEKVSECVREPFWLQGMTAGFPAAYLCIKQFSENDFTEDLKKIDVTLILHGDDDQIVPIADSKIIKNAKLSIYQGAPHGMCPTLKDRVNSELLTFLQP